MRITLELDVAFCANVVLASIKAPPVRRVLDRMASVLSAKWVIVEENDGVGSQWVLELGWSEVR